MKALIVATMLLTGAPAFAAADSNQPTAAEPRQERRICRRVDGRTSATRVTSRRLCLTAAQWRARSDAPVDDAIEILDMRSRNIESESWTGGNTQGPR